MMNRKLKCVLLLTVGLVFLAAPESQAQKKKKGKAPYVHTVIFYVKKDAPKGTTEAVIADAHKLLSGIPSVRSLKIGRPAKQSTPEVSVTDYQVGLLVFFDDYAGLKIYLEHPKHLKYVAKHKDSFEKVLVYDFVDQKK